MKKLFLAVAALGMLLTSCAKDDAVEQSNAGNAFVSFCVNAPAVATRYGEGQEATKLQWAVYETKTDASGAVTINHLEELDGYTTFSISTTVDFSLIQGRSYEVLFWAADEDAPYTISTENRTMTVNYGENFLANQESYDAFYKYESLGTVNGAISQTIELTRPFAQLNIATADTVAAAKADLTVAKTAVKVKNIFSTLNLATGAVENEVEATFALADRANGTIEANGTEYDQIAMNYLLVGAKKLVDVELTINDEGLTRSYSSVPVQRNYRTNIVGNILTSPADFKVTILPGFAEPDYVKKLYAPIKDEDGNTIEGIAGEVGTEEIDANGAVVGYSTVVVTAPEGMAALSALVAADGNGFEGKTAKLDTDIDLAAITTVARTTTKIGDSDAPIGSTGERDSRGRLICEAFKGTFDGAGHTISNLYQSGWDFGYEWGQYGSIGMFAELEDATVKNIVIDGMIAEVEGGDISFIAGSATGTCVFENITIKNSSIGTYNNGCGGIIGWSGAGNYTFKNITLESDVVLGGLWGSFDSSIGGIVGQAEPGATYNFEDITINCRIDAYNDVTAAYKYYCYRMCGMIIGRCEKTITVDGTNYPDLSQYNISFKNVAVNFGEWMNYHYCVVEGKTAWRVEPGFAYGGVPADHDHSTCAMHCNLYKPFDVLIGGAQYGVYGLRTIDNPEVKVTYPASYDPNH